MREFYWFFLLICTLISGNTRAQEYRSEIIKSSTHVQLKGNNLIQMDTTIMQVNERMGDHDAAGSINYQKGEKVSFGDILIEDTKGNRIRKLNKNEIKDRSYINGFSLYQDQSVKYFEAKHHQYPYRLSYTTKQETKRYTNAVWMDCSNIRQPIREGRLILEHPIDRPIKQKVKNIDSYKTDTIDQTVFHYYTYSYKPDQHKERYSSVNSNDAPQIIISPINFKYGVNGENRNWETFGRWNYELNKNRDILPQTEKDKLNRLTNHIENRFEQIKILYEYLQDNTRYVNISTQIGGLQTFPAEYVANNKYGDCKALSNYMQAMLKHVGIESFYTLIYASNNIHDLEENYSYNAFNHAILTIPLGSDTIFLDCTLRNTPTGYIHTSIQGRKALLTQEHGSKLINMPQLTNKDVLCTREFNIDIDNEENADIYLKTKERGSDYELLNAYQEVTNRNTIDRFIRENILDGSFDITKYEITKVSRDSAYIDLEIDCKISNIYKKYGKNLVVNPIPIYLPKFEDPKRRTQDVQIDYPIYKKDKLIIHPGDNNISKTPKNIQILSPYGDSYQINYTQKEGTIIIEKELLITAKRLKLDEYEDFYQFVTKVKNSEISNFYFEIL